MAPRFTILLPVIRPPALLPFAIESVLDQSVTDFELCVICDGAPAETIACAESFAQRDDRVKVFAHPKGGRNGEAWRHAALMRSDAQYVAQIADDDLWLPRHLAEMDILLSRVDFGNTLHVYVKPDGALAILPGNLAEPATRARMLDEHRNYFGPTCAGYRLEAYRRLPEGWAPAPPDIWSDLHMWRKFLRQDGLSFGTCAAVTALQFATPHRADVTLEQRAAEIRAWRERILDPQVRAHIVQAAWCSLVDHAQRGDDAIAAMTAELARLRPEHATLTRDLAEAHAQLRHIMASTSWRITAPLRALFGVMKRG